MFHSVICVRPDITAEQAMAIMTDKRIRHLPVVVKDRVDGMISIGDVVRGIIENKQLEIQQLKEYIHLRE